MAQKKKVTIEKLALTVQRGFNEMNEKLDQKPDRAEVERMIDIKLTRKADKSDIERVLTRIGIIGGKVNDYRAEQAVTQRQVDKHEKWHHQTVQKIGIKLEE